MGRSYLFGLALFGLVLALASAAAQEPTLVRLSDAVCDTIDAAERDSFRLFPNTAGFQHAVILALPGPEYYADVTLADGDTSRQVYFRILPNQLERIRFLVDNRDYMTGQLRSDPNTEPALASFWEAIENYPRWSIAGKPAYTQGTEPSGADTATTDGPQPTSIENRYNHALHGATCGSVVGGCVGAYTGYTLIVPGHYDQTCLGPIYIPSLYQVNLAAALAPSIAATAAGVAAGYALGRAQDLKSAPVHLDSEGTRWRTGCMGAGILPAIGIGFLAAVAAHNTLYGREPKGHNVENDPGGVSAIPAVLTGLCVSVEVVTICHHIGRAIDRRNAEEAKARRRALGR